MPLTSFELDIDQVHGSQTVRVCLDVEGDLADVIKKIDHIGWMLRPPLPTLPLIGNAPTYGPGAVQDFPLYTASRKGVEAAIATDAWMTDNEIADVLKISLQEVWRRAALGGWQSKVGESHQAGLFYKFGSLPVEVKSLFLEQLFGTGEDVSVGDDVPVEGDDSEAEDPHKDPRSKDPHSGERSALLD